MANPVWDGMVTYAIFSGATTSSSFNIPKGTGAVTIIMPSMTTDTTYAIHGLDPQDKTTWRQVFSYDPGDGSSQTLSGIPHNQYTVFPGSALGLGTFRLVAPATAQNLTVTILIDRII